MSKIISISGVESSGKSTLAKALSNYYNSELIEEQSRNYLKNIGKNYCQDDLLKIAQLYLEKLNLKIKQNPKLIFTDTSVIDIIVWSEIKYKKVNSDLMDFLNEEHKLHYLICEPDLPYVEDELRESPTLERRMLIHNTFKKKIKSNLLGFVKGQDEKRIKSAIELIDSQITF